MEGPLQVDSGARSDLEFSGQLFMVFRVFHRSLRRYPAKASETSPAASPAA